MENQIEQIEVELDNGEKVQADVLFTFEANGENFIMYAIDEKAFGAKISHEGKLSKIADDEWKLVEPLFDEYLEKEDNDN